MDLSLMEGMKLSLVLFVLDGGNDMTMLEFAEIGVAMGNANDEVKSHADYVTDTSENDGILKAFQHFGIL